MAAGLGFKTFNTGEVLTSADVNGYLMQGVLVFASEAARDAAITSPQEGQFAYTKDNNSLWYYTGSAWAASGATGDIEGVTAGTGISGGGTSGTVTITNSMATAIDAKGDLVVGTGADTFARLAVGANDTILVAASGEATGLKWAAPAAGGGMTLINTGGTTLTGSSVSIQSIPATYNSLIVYLVAPRPATDNAFPAMIYNNDGTAKYRYSYDNADDQTFSLSDLKLNDGNKNTDSRSLIVVEIPQYASTSSWKMNLNNSISGSSTVTYRRSWGAWNQHGTAVNRLDFYNNTGNWSSGTVYVYGVK